MSKKNSSIQTIALEFVEKRDNDSFSKLIKRLQPGLLSHVYKYIQDRDKCKEIVSETFTTVWEKIDQYNPEYNFSTWAYAIAKNIALGIIRIEKRNISHEKLVENHSKALIKYSPVANLEIEVIGPSGEDLIRELYDASIAAIHVLKEPYKTVMIEREVNQKQLQDIATNLGWNLSTVKTRLRKARKDIAENLVKTYPELVEAYNESK